MNAVDTTKYKKHSIFARVRASAVSCSDVAVQRRPRRAPLSLQTWRRWINEVLWTCVNREYNYEITHDDRRLGKIINGLWARTRSCWKQLATGTSPSSRKYSASEPRGAVLLQGKVLCLSLKNYLINSRLTWRIGAIFIFKWTNLTPREIFSLTGISVWMWLLCLTNSWTYNTDVR